MRILHISWEYSPVVYGGLGRHVIALSRAQAGHGHDVSVLTQRPAGSPLRQRIERVEVIRVARQTPAVVRTTTGLLRWVSELDADLASTIASGGISEAPDVIHAHDWVVATAAHAATKHWDAPLVTTIHATEAGRHFGWINGDASRHIHATEALLTHRSTRVIACSRSMKLEVAKLFGLSDDRIDVIPNGIDLGRIGQRVDRPPDTPSPIPIVAFVGRLEWEKGVHTLIDAARIIDNDGFGGRVIIAGNGTQDTALRSRAADLSCVEFAGWLPDNDIAELLSEASVAVVPSLYEPFGMVALEIAAAQTPLIVADTGGLSDIVRDGVTGLVVAPADPGTLAAAIGTTLANPAAARERARRLTAALSHDYGWDTITASTSAAYLKAMATPSIDASMVDLTFATSNAADTGRNLFA